MVFDAGLKVFNIFMDKTTNPIIEGNKHECSIRILTIALMLFMMKYLFYNIIPSSFQILLTGVFYALLIFISFKFFNLLNKIIHTHSITGIIVVIMILFIIIL